MYQTAAEIGYRILHPVPYIQLPLTVASPAQVSQPLRYGFDSSRRFATE